ncbi:MAG: penicillin-insensitive murein endopeptidase [Nannocystaceae bacterium]
MAERAPKVVVRRPGPRRAWVLRLCHADGRIEQRRVEAPALVRIGSREGVELVLRGAGIAPHHASLRLDDDAALLTDRGSPLGTYVNAVRAREPRRLGAEDRVTIAGALLTVRAVPRRPDTSPLRAGFLAPESDERTPALATTMTRSTRRTVHRMVVALGTCSTALAAVAAYAAVTLGLAAASPTWIGGTLDAARSATAPPLADPTAPAWSEDPGAAPATPTRRWTVHAGDTWESLGWRLEVPTERLRALNPAIRRPLRGGDQVLVPAPAEAPSSAAARCGLDLAIPGGAAALGEVTQGSLSEAIQVPELDFYRLRCKPHAFATSHTARHLLDAIACFRAHTGYEGEVVIGDISREHGGPLGNHKSHQAGRDVDLWLPVVGGRYLRGCVQCGTDLCRPEPEAIDWRATWELVDALAATGEVQVIFLDVSLQPHLRDAALAAGASPRLVEERIQWPRTGAPTLVQHADGHVHHMHVRFRCGTDEAECSEHLTRRR